MFNRVEKQCKKLIAKAHPITIEQSYKLTRVLGELGLPYTVFFDDDEGIDNKIIHLSNDVFIVEDYFKDFKLPGELVESIE